MRFESLALQLPKVQAVAGIALPLLLAAPAMASREAELTRKADPDLVALAGADGVDWLMIRLTEQADASEASALPTKREKTRFVFETLRDTAQQTQGPLLDELERLGLEAKPYFIINQVLVTAPAGQRIGLDLLADLATREDVARLDLVRPAWLPEQAPGATPVAKGSPAVQHGGPTVAPNIEAVGAKLLYDRNIRGQGMVVGVSDSGAIATHPALANNYRGTGGTHDYNWFDPTPAASIVPEDTNGHGTHVTGIAVGLSPTNHIGVAPEATWIACRGVGPGANAATVLSCLQWFLAPTDVTGANPNPNLAPDVTNHSYICPFCEHQTAYANLVAAGIFVVGVTGNFGPTCESPFDPGTYPIVTAIGATDPGGRDAPLGEYSSRGPWEDRILPHLVAPGTEILSALPPDAYATSTGTSQAAPHVTGGVALLWSSRPDLHGRVEKTRNTLLASAYPRLDAAGVCSSPTAIPNNLYGYGFLDLFRPVFSDDFETGDTTAWSAIVP